MATFPESPVPVYPLTISPRFSTISTGMDSGAEERTAKWLFPKYDVAVKYDALSATDAQTLWNFYLARKGGYEAFYIFDLSLIASVTKSHVDQYVGTGDGTTTIFDIPGRSTSGQTIAIDASDIDPGDYTILVGGGSSEADRVEFDNAPDAGAIITASFSGYLRIRVCFAQDSMDQALFITNLYTMGLEMKGLAAA
jgi:hypothetical protein